ncbi:arsenical-resistance protein ACR3 [Lachnospiraceae bacterium KM106-2]|nr:arsenical-resistance protein ACR3 [Lachnospiraceae bacterium KM106-2]
MNLIGKLQPLIIMVAALLGLILGNFSLLGTVSSNLIEIFLMLLLYILFLSVDLKQIKQSLSYLRYTCAAVVINFIITPFVAYVLGRIFFENSVDIRIGLMMLLITPCTDWYLVFTGLSKGNIELNMSILPLNLILQIVLMPFYLFMFMGREVVMDISTIVGSIVMVLLIPFIASVLTRMVVRNKEKFQDFISSQGDNLQLLFLCLAVVIMFASEGKKLLDNPMLLIEMFIPLMLFFAITFFIGQMVGRFLKFKRKDIVALNFTTLARNSPLSLAIAVATFPNQPLISLALVIGLLIELPVLSFISGILLRWNQKEI